MGSKIPYRYQPRGDQAAQLTLRLLIALSAVWGAIVLVALAALLQ